MVRLVLWSMVVFWWFVEVVCLPSSMLEVLWVVKSDNEALRSQTRCLCKDAIRSWHLIVHLISSLFNKKNSLNSIEVSYQLFFMVYSLFSSFLFFSFLSILHLCFFVSLLLLLSLFFLSTTTTNYYYYFTLKNIKRCITWSLFVLSPLVHFRTSSYYNLHSLLSSMTPLLPYHTFSGTIMGYYCSPPFNSDFNEMLTFSSLLSSTEILLIHYEQRVLDTLLLTALPKPRILI
jgi:hypothetical protein